MNCEFEKEVDDMKWFFGKKLVAIVLGAVLAVGGTIAGIAIYQNNPKVIVRDTLENFTEDLLERQEIKPFVQMLQKGSLELNAEYTEERNTLAFGGKLYFNDEKVYLENGNFEYLDNTLSLDAYFGKNCLYIDNEDILGGTYGIVSGESAQAFEDSLFAYGSNSAFELSYEKSAAVAELLDAYDTELYETMQKDFTKLLNDYYKILRKAISENAEFEKEIENVSVGGERDKYRVIKITIDGDAMVNILEALYDELKGDEDAEAFVSTYFETFKYTFISLGLFERTSDVENAYDDLLDELEQTVEDLEDQNLDGAFVIELTTARASDKLVKLSTYTDGFDEDYQIFTLDVGRDGIKKSESITVEFDEGDEVLSYEVTANSSKEFCAMLTHVAVVYDYYEGKRTEAQTLFALEIDKKDDEIELELADGDVTLKGGFSESWGKITLSFEKIYMEDERIDAQLNIVIDEKDSFPKTISESDVKSFFELSEADIKNIVTKLEEFD